MTKQNGSILDELALFPWWVGVILAVIVYLSLKYWIPTIKFQNTFYAGTAKAAPGLAPFLAGIMLAPAAVSAFFSWRKGPLPERQKGTGGIRSIAWREFEGLVSEAYKRLGYSVTETGAGAADGGVDLILRKNDEELFVLLRHWKLEEIGVTAVRELYGVVAAEGASGGVVLCSGAFTQEALDFAGGKPMELIEGTTLARMVEEVKKNPILINVNSILPGAQRRVNLCPLCGGEMVPRTAGNGANAGKKFWGCSAFPECRGTKPFDA
ncbi:MAG: restriction endonuclease [Syntrophobacteraceae bacterium]|jgi:restriction system protein